MKTLLYFFFFLFAFTATAQNAYYDAIYLKASGKPEARETTNKIHIKMNNIGMVNTLKDYIDEADQDSVDMLINQFDLLMVKKDSLKNSGQDTLEIDNVLKTKIRKIQDLLLQDNPFLDFSGTGQSNAVVKVGAQTRKSISAISGINVTTIVDGLTQFLIDRATEELNVAFFNQFKNFIQETPEAKVLFPTTTGYISNFSPHEYSTFIATLRRGFHSDLKNLIYTVDDVFLLPKYSELIDRFPEITISINCIQLIVDLEDGMHPVEVIKNFKDLPAWENRRAAIDNNGKYALRNLHNGLKASYLFSNSVRTVVDTVNTYTLKAVKPITIDSGSCILNGENLPYTHKQIVYDSLIRYHIRIDMDTFILTKKRIPEIVCDKLRFTEILVDSSMLSKINHRAWVSIKDFRKNILEDTTTFKIFLGLIYMEAKRDSMYFLNNVYYKEEQKIESNQFLYFGKNSFIGKGSKLKDSTGAEMSNIENKSLLSNGLMAYQGTVIGKGTVRKADTIRVHDFMAKNKTKLILFQSLFLEVLEKGKTVDEAMAEIKNKKMSGTELTQDDYYKYINSSIDVVEYGFKLVQYIDQDIDAVEYFEIVRNANNLYKNVYEKQYATAIMNATTVFDLTFTLISEDYRVLETKARQNKKNAPLFKKGDEKDTLKFAKNNLDAIEANIKVIPKLLRYGTFIANVVETDNPAEVKAAIEAAALPVGSSMIKKYYCGNLAVNAYLGGYYRLEKASEVHQSWDTRLGFIAPVGLAFTPLSGGRKGSLTFFGSLIDVGAVAQFRLSNDSTQIKEEITLGNIFSPGGYIVYGFGRDMPLSFGVGTQYGPGLFSVGVNHDQNQATPNIYKPSWRLNAFLAVDIPVINLNKGKRIKNLK